VKVLLMRPSEEFDPERDLPPESEDLVEDLGVGTLFGAMAQGDKFILTVARAAVLSCLSEPEEILYRQEVLADLTAHPQLAIKIYSLATEALEAHRKVTFWTLNISPESLRYYSAIPRASLGLPRASTPFGRGEPQRHDVARFGAAGFPAPDRA